MFSDQVIRVGGAGALPHLLAEQGIDFEALATEAGMSAAVFENPDSVVPIAALCRLLSLAVERSGICDIGLRACLSTGPTALGKLGYLVANSATVERGLAVLGTYFQLHDQGAMPTFSRHEGLASIGYEILAPNVPGADQLSYGALAIGANILRGLCGPEFRLLQVTIAYRRPANGALFRSFFGAPVHFGAERNSLTFDERWLARPVATADSYLCGLLAAEVRRDCDHLVEPVEDRIRRVVRSLVAAGKFSVEDVAAAFGVDRRTLARHLRARGTTFRSLLDEARHEEARRMLQSSSASITNIAARLGYADAATFTRAFRRWGGTSPRRWQAARSAI